MPVSSKSLFLVFIIFFLASISLLADSGGVRQYPLPRPEVEEIIKLWLLDSGYIISRGQKGEEVKIKATKGPLLWNIELNHKSVLATQVGASFVMDGIDTSAQPLWDFLNSYLNKEAAPAADVPKTVETPKKFASKPSGNTPKAILEHLESIVCISAKIKDETIKITGFVVNEAGLIICTAHYLNDAKSLEITVYDGTLVAGKIIKSDPLKDVALIDCDYKFQKAIQLAKGASALKPGQAIYGFGCPANNGPTVTGGKIKKEANLVDGQLLLEAQMQVEPGNSGSPVFSADGTFIAMIKGRLKGDDQLGFLVPKETIIEFIQKR